jgi:ABC-2 type transport system permease protein
LVVLAILVEPARRPEIVLAPAALAALQGLASINLFGADRGAVELLVGAGVDAKADLGGKNLSTLILVLPIMTVAAVALAIVTGGWSYVPLTLALTGALLGVAFGVGGIVSVYAPMPLPESPTNPFAGAAGIGATTLLLQGGAMLGELLLLAPVAVAVFLTALFARGLLPLVVAAGVLYGGLIALAGIKIASGRLRTRAPEFLEALRVRNTP